MLRNYTNQNILTYCQKVGWNQEAKEVLKTLPYHNARLPPWRIGLLLSESCPLSEKEDFIVRYLTDFHNLRDGECSCRDFW